MAEIIPFEPDTDNAGVGSGKTKTIIGAISYEGKGYGFCYLMYVQGVEKIGSFELREFFRLCPREIYGAGRPKKSSIRS
jgi:hypothetical protein